MTAVPGEPTLRFNCNCGEADDEQSSGAWIRVCGRAIAPSSEAIVHQIFSEESAIDRRFIDSAAAGLADSDRIFSALWLCAQRVGSDRPAVGDLLAAPKHKSVFCAEHAPMNGI